MSITAVPAVKLLLLREDPLEVHLEAKEHLGKAWAHYNWGDVSTYHASCSCGWKAPVLSDYNGGDAYGRGLRALATHLQERMEGAAPDALLLFFREVMLQRRQDLEKAMEELAQEGVSQERQKAFQAAAWDYGAACRFLGLLSTPTGP